MKNIFLNKRRSKVSSNTKKLFCLSVGVIFANQQIHAQQISGKVIDSNGAPVELVNVLLYNAADSIFLTGTITNQDGGFILKNTEKKEFYLKLSCIGFQEFIYPVIQDEYTEYVIKENSLKLNEITVTANKPIVKVDEGRLSFDVQALIKQRPVNSAFDILGEIPGVEKTGEKINIIGANSSTIIVNNRVSSMSLDQIIDYLKSIPPEQVKTVEILYVTPPGYGVNGSSINIIIDNNRRTGKRESKAQLTLAGEQAHYFSPSIGTSFSSANEKSLLNVIYSFRDVNMRPGEELDAVHKLGNDTHSVTLENSTKTAIKAHNIGVSYDYDINKKDKMSFSYNARINDSDSKMHGSVLFDDDRKYKSVNKRTGPSVLHNISMNYSRSDLLIGVDFLYYDNKKNQFLVNSIELSSDSISSNSNQTINKYSFYINNQHTINGKQKISYGINTDIGFSDNDQSTFINNIADNGFSQEQSEYSAGGFVGWSHSLGKKISFNLNLSLEYYKAMINPDKVKQTLWENWDLYPSLSMVYRIAPMKMLQLTVLSEKKYPAYWQTTPNITYMNYYMTLEGNPRLKPAKTYSGRLNYVLNGRYIFQLFGNASSGYIQQSLYQSSEKLLSTYKIVNLSKHDTFGTMAVLPFRIGQIIDSRLILSGFLIHDKGELEEVSFDRKKIFSRLSMNNNFFLNAKKSLSIQLSGSYSTKAIQGIYDVKPMYNLSAGVVWDINNRLKINMVGDDMLNGRKGRTSTALKNQNYNQIINNDSRMVSVSIRYNISGYKEKNIADIDTSRFGL